MALEAFDSIHHPSLWHIMSMYGLPPKVINIVKDMYANNLCCVRHEGQHSEWFQVKTGVRQGCIISPLLFLIVIDYVIRTATADKPCGLVWGLFHRLEDSDFADDLALLAHTHSDIKEKTDRVASTAKKVGLKIHAAKTKVMKAKNKFRLPVTVQGEPLEEVKDFKYLGSYISSDSNINNLALLAHTHSDIKEKTDRVASTAKKVGLKIHAAKTKVMKAKNKFRLPVTVEGEPLEEVKDFKYLGSYISSDSNINKEVSTRIGLAAQAFKKLNNMWKSTTLSTKTKLRMYQSNVRSTLRYASETWRTNKKLESKLQGYEGRCLRRILKVRWQEKACNEEIWRRTGMNNIVLEVKRRRWMWLGHVLRMKKGRHRLEALSCLGRGTGVDHLALGGESSRTR